jgi:hypothetical protein
LQVTKGPIWTRRGEAYQSDAARASLRLALLEAALWATTHGDVRDPCRSLRSAALAPYRFNESRHDSVHDVAWSRHARLEAEGRVRRIGGQTDEIVDLEVLGLAEALHASATGRLLVWERDTTIDDGAGEAETQGYLDDSDMPPWDTWVAYVDCPEPAAPPHCPYLVSWVSPVFVDAVDRAVRVNAYDALYWLRDSKLLMASLLRSDGLLV